MFDELPSESNSVGGYAADAPLRDVVIHAVDLLGSYFPSDGGNRKESHPQARRLHRKRQPVAGAANGQRCKYK